MATIARPLVITGTDTVLRNLNREIMGIRNRSKAGLREAILVVRKRSQELTPVGETGNLRAWVHTEVYDTPKGPGAVIGYEANYAVYVHEIPPPPARSPGGRSATHKVGQWKYLETALKEKQHEILEIIRKRARPGIGR